MCVLADHKKDLIQLHNIRNNRDLVSTVTFFQ